MKVNHRWMIVLLIVTGLQLSACAQEPAAGEKIAPAYVELLEGTDLKRVVLTEKAAERLGIQTAPVREEQVTRTRTVGGEVVAVLEADAAGSSAIWVRVIFNESDLNQVDRGQPVLIRLLDDEDDDKDDEQGVDDDLEAEADEPPEGVSVDDSDDNDPDEGALYYVVANADQSLVPGQRVWVQLSLLGSGTSRLIVPYAAVIYDVNGATWVYTNPKPLVFIRQSISIDYIEGDLAFLTAGSSAGTKVVTVGGAELYGAETGVSK